MAAVARRSALWMTFRRDGVAGFTVITRFFDTERLQDCYFIKLCQLCVKSSVFSLP